MLLNELELKNFYFSNWDTNVMLELLIQKEILEIKGNRIAINDEHLIEPIYDNIFKTPSCIQPLAKYNWNIYKKRDRFKIFKLRSKQTDEINGQENISEKIIPHN